MGLKRSRKSLGFRGRCKASVYFKNGNLGCRRRDSIISAPQHTFVEYSKVKIPVGGFALHTLDAQTIA
ncbi:hypothetical protein O998_00980 [Anaplasma phagocytophilum str. Norway variant1]|uniref:Uncharacterized protein n=1 Tax=Anaplasma phagocytophilum str. Norway variant1 TaxID=1392506 RepID=A0A7H9DY93_ANAPH|nr:hypothetical protein [Anaplasma phagocytophilum]QLL66465.1 hypothetical protein O998_00980 [Anaplasma phagocytophilum str. Norway variant1]